MNALILLIGLMFASPEVVVYQGNTKGIMRKKMNIEIVQTFKRQGRGRRCS